MKIKELLNYLSIDNDDESEIVDIVTSTKDVVSGCVLICVNGHNINPNRLITPEISKKCLCILSDEEDTPFQYISELKSRVFEILDYFYFNHNHPFHMIGITGTEGKSSLANIIYQALNINHKKAFIISPTPYLHDSYQSERTTPSPKEIIEAMKEAKRGNYSYFIMEVSSIGIAEKRVDLKIFDELFLTNLAEDHLDYHQNIYHYHMCKLSLFLENKKAKKYVFRETYNKYPNIFSKCTNLIILDENNIILKNNSLRRQVFIYKDVKYSSELLFKQNRYNLVFLIEYLSQMHIKSIYQTINKIKRVKGRIDIVHTHPYIMIDYAHSKKAFEMVLKELSFFKTNRLIVVFGAGGQRDPSKRKDYGVIARKYADLIILTNDNPRFENPEKIIEMILDNHTEKTEVILSREQAIQKAITIAQKDDIIAILGRGNELTQKIRNKVILLNDYEVVKTCLKSAH